MQDYKNFKGSGMDSDSARESIAPNDTDVSYNLRFAGTEEKEEGDATNIESNEKITASVPAGLNKAIGAASFESVRKAYGFKYNSAGYHAIVEIDYDLRTETVIYTNLTDSAAANILPLNPQFYVNDIKLIQGKYLAFTDNNMQPCYINLDRLKSGGYGTLTIDDFRLIKAQPIIQPIAAYGNDAGRSVNTVRGNLFQFREQFVRLDDEYSAWGTISKREVPSDEPTPAFGTDVTKGNHLVVTVDAGDDRVKTINVAARIALLDWMLIKSIDRADVLLLPTAIDIPNQVYEAYNPTTNLYSLAFYNDGLYPNIDVLETDSAYDHVPLLAGALEVLNGAILALGDITEGYDRPTVDVSLSVSAYDPHIAVQQPDPSITFRVVSQKDDGNAGGHRRNVTITYAGTAKTGDVMYVTLRNLQDGGKLEYSYTVPVTQNNDSQAAINSLSATIPGSNTTFNALYIKTPAYFELDSASVDPQNAGTGVSKSIGDLKTNSSYQFALAHYDKYGRYFPIVTDSRFVVKTQSYAQTNGLPSQVSWRINSLTAPAEAVSYQWLISENNTHQSSLYVTALLDNTLSVGDYLVFKINSLLAFNTTNSSSVLSYDYTAGDRCTFQSMTQGAAGAKSFFNNPSVDVEVVGFEIVVDTVPTPDVTNYLLKVRKSSAIVTADLVANNILLEIYTPRKRVNVTGGVTTNNPVLFYEFGERFDIVNGGYGTTTGTISQADSYYKTREMENAVDGSLNSYLVEDFNFSDFYKSNYTSYGRPRTYDDEPGRIRKKASIRYSDQSLIGVKKNGLTRFFLERIYGDNPGETSSNYGAIGKLRQRDNYLVCIQELKVGHIPVNISILEDQAEKQNVSVSDKLLNYIRYIQSGNYGIGTAKESYAESQNGTIYFIDPNNSLPIRDGYDGVRPISGKMSKFFRRTIQAAVKEGKKIIGYFDNYNVEYHAATEQSGDILTTFTFSSLDWRLANTFTIPAATLLQVTAPTKGSIAINTTTGKAIYTPTTGQTGADTFSYSFVVGGVTYTRNECGTITAGNTEINEFHFGDLIDKEPSTSYTSNSILVSGNDIPVAISIASGEYEVNGSGTWTSAAGMVNNGDTVKVRRTSSASLNTQVGTTLTISGYSDTFDITTGNNVPVAFTFIDVVMAALSTAYTSNPQTISGITLPAAISISAGQYNINGGTFTSSPGTVVNGDVVRVKQTSSASEYTTTNITLTVQGVSDTYSVKTTDYYDVEWSLEFNPQVNISTLMGSSRTGSEVEHEYINGSGTWAFQPRTGEETNFALKTDTSGDTHFWAPGGSATLTIFKKLVGGSEVQVFTETVTDQDIVIERQESFTPWYFIPIVDENVEYYRTEATSDAPTAVAVKYAAIEAGICALTFHTVYIASSYADIATGATVYTDAFLTTVLTGQSFITSAAGDIYNINSTTGVVGSTTGGTCSLGADYFLSIHDEVIPL